MVVEEMIGGRREGPRRQADRDQLPPGRDGVREAGCGPPPAQPTDTATRPSHTPAGFANRPLTPRTAPICIALPTSSSMCPKRRRRKSDFCALARHGRAGTQKSELRRRRVGHGLGLGGGARLIGAVWGVHGGLGTPAGAWEGGAAVPGGGQEGAGECSAGSGRGTGERGGRANPPRPGCTPVPAVGSGPPARCSHELRADPSLPPGGESNSPGGKHCH